MMAIFKAVTTPKGEAVGHATPAKLEEYLKFQQDEFGKTVRDKNGEKVARDAIVTSLNTGEMDGQIQFAAFTPAGNHELALREGFSSSCRTIAAIHGKNIRFDSLKYKHYVQAFPEEDSRRMSREKCHELGVEAAKTFWPGFPVLIVTHFDQAGEDGYHWHNHFLVYNCHAETGRKIRTGRAEMIAQKRFIAMQADANGLTRRGLIMDENGQIKRSDQPAKPISQIYQERKMVDGVDPDSLRRVKEGNKRTQKAVLKLCIITAALKARDYNDFQSRLADVGVKMKESRGSISFLHPDRAGAYRQGSKDGWIRGATLGSDYTKEVIERVIQENEHRRHGSHGGTDVNWRGSVYEIYFRRGGEGHGTARDLELLNSLAGEGGETSITSGMESGRGI